MSRHIVFLSDFGLNDEFVGVCHGVIARIAPRSHVIDLTHGVPARDVRRGATMLADAVPFMPDGAVFLAVVDPGVGTDRRAVAVRAANGQVFIGPDNGLLSLAVRAAGGAHAAVLIESGDVVLVPVSRTFHGRDVFAPAAAHMAEGMPLEDLGPQVDPGSLTGIDLPEPQVAPGRLSCEVLAVDGFGNVKLAATEDDLRRAGLGSTSRVAVRGRGGDWVVEALVAPTFADLPDGSYGLIVNSTGRLMLVRNAESAAAALGVGSGVEVTITGEAG
jgi:S-adenosyl-L-methionine hydrolase (adenosine-forming)